MVQRLFIFAIISGLVFTACEKKKMESEYFNAGYDFYNDQQPEKAIENFKNLLEFYPDGEKAAGAMFMIGFIYANNMQKYEEAKTYYTMFIDKYPEHELIASARYELETLGKDINELDIFNKISNDSTEVEPSTK